MKKHRSGAWLTLAIPLLFSTLAAQARCVKIENDELQCCTPTLVGNRCCTYDARGQLLGCRNFDDNDPASLDNESGNRAQDTERDFQQNDVGQPAYNPT